MSILRNKLSLMVKKKYSHQNYSKEMVHNPKLLVLIGARENKIPCNEAHNSS